MKLWHLTLVISLTIISSASAAFWQCSIGTNSSSWSIYRHSGNITFTQSGLIEGKIAPVEYHDTLLKPYSSYYSEIGYNDIQLRERTSALEGDYRSEDEMSLWSVVEEEITIDYVKPYGTDSYTFTFTEKWPVSLASKRSLQYSGSQINDRDFEGNNRDYAGSNLLYNSELSKERLTVMWLESMNATVQANDISIIRAQLMPTRYLGYKIQTNTTGIADLRYRHAGSEYNVKRYDYPPLSEGNERYYGTYALARKIEMRSQFPNYNDTIEWLPCCGLHDLNSIDELSVDTVFNCSNQNPLVF